MNKSNKSEELLPKNQDENHISKEFDWGEDMGRERIWSMTDEEYNKEYGQGVKE